MAYSRVEFTLFFCHVIIWSAWLGLNIYFAIYNMICRSVKAMQILLLDFGMKWLMRPNTPDHIIGLLFRNLGSES